jgi:hypothetical protein
VNVAKIKQSGFGNAIACGLFRPKRRKIMRSGNIPQNQKHLDMIRELTCILADDPRHKCSGVVEAAHLGARGRGQKAPDETAVPMCANAHRTGIKALHKGEKTFFEYWVVRSKERLILDYSTLGRCAGTITEENLWLKQQQSKVA